MIIVDYTHELKHFFLNMNNTPTLRRWFYYRMYVSDTHGILLTKTVD